ncbi:AEC family transporter [Pyruvatibacter mobilis]|uniref:AEC family transporter n=1 Tax=Pyruvatibacter mobilis TaxID=1712261 RepID=UPI003BABF925
MLPIIYALIPVFLVIALGACARRIGFPGEEFWPPLDRVTYFILFPALLVHSLVAADFENLPVPNMATALFAGLITMSLVMMALRPLIAGPMGQSGPAFTSMFQGATRWNSFVALAASFALFGNEGLALAAVGIGVLVPTVNVLCVFILMRYAGDEPARLMALGKLLIRNPMVIACAVGIFLNASGIGLWEPVLAAVDILGRAALALGLLAVGAGLDLSQFTAQRGPIILTTALRLLAMPLFMAGWCWVFDVEGIARMVAIICGAVPGATASYVLARQLGGDAPLMASLITASTVCAMATMPAMIWLLN